MLLLLNKYKSIFFIVAIIGAIFLIYERGKTIQAQNDQVVALKSVVNNQNSIILKLQHQDIINNDIIQKNQTDLLRAQNNYADSQKYVEDISNKLNHTTRINQLLVRSLENFATTTTVSTISESASESNDATTYVNSTDFTLGVGEQLNYCNQEMIKLQSLQQWILQTQENFNQ